MSNIIKDFILYNLDKVDKQALRKLSEDTDLTPFHIYRLLKSKRPKSGNEVCIAYLLKSSGLIKND